MPPLFLVMAGGAIGSGFRYTLGTVTLRSFGPGFPFGTLAVNLLGGLLMGVLAGIIARMDIAGEPWRLFVGVGILGGFTTFSAFSLETYTMLVRGEAALAGCYALGSIIGSVAMLLIGVQLVRAIA